jgi:hypothetical protein
MRFDITPSVRHLMKAMAAPATATEIVMSVGQWRLYWGQQRKLRMTLTPAYGGKSCIVRVSDKGLTAYKNEISTCFPTEKDSLLQVLHEHFNRHARTACDGALAKA